MGIGTMNPEDWNIPRKQIILDFDTQPLIRTVDILGNKTKEDSHMNDTNHTNHTNSVVNLKTYTFPETVKDRFFIMRVPNVAFVELDDEGESFSTRSEGPHRAYESLEEAVERAKWYCMKRKQRGEVFRYIILKSVATIEPESPPVEVTIFDNNFTDND